MAMRTPEPEADRSRKGAFTLIELLTVMAIIVILVSLIIGAAVFAQRAVTIARTKAQIEQICNALQEYKLQNGTFPGPVGGGGVSHSAIEFWLDKKITYTNDAITDPWRNPYRYSLQSSESFTLYSTGPNIANVNGYIYSGK